MDEKLDVNGVSSPPQPYDVVKISLRSKNYARL